MTKKIVVAMSGGVDSSVAALLMKEAGYDVVGISMQVWDYRQNGGCDSKATCCSPDDFTDARKVADVVGVPYYVFDFESSFREKVIDKFINTYKTGNTPNPCIDCNNNVKFAELRERALSLGCAGVATGHYAQIEKRDDGYHLLRGLDPHKDQSYFLYGMKQDELAQTYFPVGHMTKDDVRACAARAGLSTASKPESQDICFVSGSLKDFLLKHGGSLPEGNISRRDGTVLGRHDGIHNYTVGQRRGLNIGGASEPLYVLELQKDTHTVVVGTKSELEEEGFLTTELNIISPEYRERLARGERVTIPAIAQMRHRHDGTPVTLTLSGNSAEAYFVDEWSTISPGQAAVFYDESNTEVLAGGRIQSRIGETAKARVLTIL